MKEYSFIVPFPPSSNTAYPTFIRNGKLTKCKSKKYVQWLKEVPPIAEKMKHKRCKIHYLIFFPDDRIRDGQSYMKTTLDYLVKQGFINDDNRRIVTGECWEDGGIDKDNPRIEITIKAYN